MKKYFKFYVIIWAVVLAIFNLLSFISLNWTDIESYTPSFWIGYAFITLCFIGQLICTCFALKDKELKKTFYKVPLIRTSYVGLIVSFVFGGLCMIIPPLPYWVGIALCALVLAFNIIAVVKAVAAAEIVGGIDDKVRTKTFFIKALTVDAERMLAEAKSDAVRTECKKVYEAVRYSDPMSNEVLVGVEGQINIKFAELSVAVNGDDTEKVTVIANDVIILLGDRNRKCKLLK